MLPPPIGLSPARLSSLLIVSLIEDAREALIALADRLGYRATGVCTLQEALSQVAAAAPAILVLDMTNADLPASDAVRQLKAAARGQRMAIVMITTGLSESDIVAGLDVGAEDYVRASSLLGLMAAKLRRISRNLRLFETLELQHQEIVARDAEDRHEAETAQHVLSRLINTDLLQDSSLHYWVRPAEGRFSGDMVLAARTPGGQLYVMLADAAGHGLSSALNALPVAQPFYSMAAKGFPMERIITEINRKVRELLPVDRFVAASLVAVDFSEQVVRVWNGGNPPVLMLDEAGKVLWRVKSSHLPLGVADVALFDAEMEVHRYDQACQILICSDGLPELSTQNHPEMLGMQGLLGWLENTRPDQRLGVIQEKVAASIGNAVAIDDISLVMVDCVEQEYGATVHYSAPPEGYASAVPQCLGGWKTELFLSAAELKTVDAVPLLMNLIEGLGCNFENRQRIYLILSELFNNALDHGLLGLDSRIKGEEDGFSRYLGLRSEGLKRLREGNVWISLSLMEKGGHPVLRIVVEDSGPGFDVAAESAGMPDQNQFHGRGIPTVRRLSYKLDYPGNGNKAVAYYRFDVPSLPPISEKEGLEAQPALEML